MAPQLLTQRASFIVCVAARLPRFPKPELSAGGRPWHTRRQCPLCIASPSHPLPQATGNFFQRDGELSPGQPTPCYYGELPLLFAACTNQPDIFRMLLEMGADLGACDANGNNVLHLCVHHRLRAMYDEVCASWDAAVSSGTIADGAVPLDERPNEDGLTPLVLAAHLGGDSAMFAHLLRRTRRVAWSYGKCCALLLSPLRPPRLLHNLLHERNLRQSPISQLSLQR